MYIYLYISVKWPNNQAVKSISVSQDEELRKSTKYKSDLLKNIAEHSSGSGDHWKTKDNAEGSGSEMLKDFLLSESDLKEKKGILHIEQKNIGDTTIEQNIRKHIFLNLKEINQKRGKLGQEFVNKNLQNKSDTGKHLSRDEKNWLHSFFGDDYPHFEDRNVSGRKHLNSSRSEGNTKLISKLNSIESRSRSHQAALSEHGTWEASGASGSGFFKESDTPSQLETSVDQETMKLTSNAATTGQKTAKAPRLNEQENKLLFHELSQYFAPGSAADDEVTRNLRFAEKDNVKFHDDLSLFGVEDLFDIEAGGGEPVQPKKLARGIKRDVKDSEKFRRDTTLRSLNNRERTLQKDQEKSTTDVKRDLNQYTKQIDAPEAHTKSSKPQEVPYDAGETGATSRETEDDTLLKINSDTMNTTETRNASSMTVDEFKHVFGNMVLRLQAHPVDSGSGMSSNESISRAEDITHSGSGSGEPVSEEDTDKGKGNAENPNTDHKVKNTSQPADQSFQNGVTQDNDTEVSSSREGNNESQSGGQVTQSLVMQDDNRAMMLRWDNIKKTWVAESADVHSKQHHSVDKTIAQKNIQTILSSARESAKATKLEKRKNGKISHKKEKAKKNSGIRKKHSEASIGNEKKDANKTSYIGRLDLPKETTYQSKQPISLQLGKIGKAKSRRKRIKLVMQRKRKFASDAGYDAEGESFRSQEDIKVC